ncbi:ral guanine nucleotide dissociation stimulator-like 1 [Salmo salar]|uniref:Ral guanine nucleotide dissociation stimulator-like 1 n=1 Tax=Salmo salar TaxID=8030 RepID=A0ABM3DSU7_SALSA|nr:ral guanine nucleotide dissociation stimulator-like 1 [Salmo salar]
MSTFEELSDILHHKLYLTSEELLMREGTSKFANLEGCAKEHQKHTHKRLQLQKEMGAMQGTIPYLGTFLTDLTMLDAARSDLVEGGLINFEKMRRFEVIAQIKLLQSACNSYCLSADDAFLHWFKNQPQHREEERYKPMSCDIEGAAGDRLPPGHTVSQLETWKICAGTLERQVETLLTGFRGNDLAYTTIFLSTYFASTHTVLQLLLDKYGIPEGSEGQTEQCRPSETKGAVRIALASILRAWLDQCPEDFQEPPSYPCFHRVMAYLQRALPGSEPMRKAQSLLEQLKAEASLDVDSDGGGFDSIRSFGLCEDEEVEIEVQEDFMSFDTDLVAEQLTCMDVLLFKKVIPHHCLGSIWSQRDKKQNKHSAPTIRATITQFNAVAACVVSTILHRRQIRPHLRARVIKRWIDIAQECRMLKNFSSLRAIVSALQSNPLYRLKRAWSWVDSMSTFEELSDILHHKLYLTSEELLMREGTSKFANLEGCAKEHQKHTHKQLQRKIEMGALQGTIPYLGITHQSHWRKHPCERNGARHSIFGETALDIWATQTDMLVCSL